jgi:hypothetical protein
VELECHCIVWHVELSESGPHIVQTIRLEVMLYKFRLGAVPDDEPDQRSSKGHREERASSEQSCLINITLGSQIEMLCIPKDLVAISRLRSSYPISAPRGGSTITTEVLVRLY